MQLLIFIPKCKKEGRDMEERDHGRETVRERVDKKENEEQVD